MGFRVVAGGAAVAALLAAGVAQAPQAGARIAVTPRTTAPDVYVTVNVTMTNTRFVLSRHAGPRGANAKFVIHNASNRTHIFAIGNEKYGTGVQTGFAIKLKPGRRTTQILYLDFRGKLPYYPGLPTDRKHPGMKGVFMIGPCTRYEILTGVPEC